MMLLSAAVSYPFWCFAVIALLLAAFYCTQTVLGIFQTHREATLAGPNKPSFAVLVPAHNEASNLLSCLNSLNHDLYAKGRIVVIADNCSDNTAAIARSAGVAVIERINPVLRGKGYALASGFEALATNPPDVVIIIDADCLLVTGTLANLALEAFQRRRPVQAMYSMGMPSNPGNGTRISAFAWLVKNEIRPNGLERLQLPCQLMGSGMAIRYDQLVSLKLDTGDLVEDMSLGIDCALNGSAPKFSSQFRVVSLFPSNEEGLRTQRERWESGHLLTIAQKAPKLLLRGIIRCDRALIAMALDLMIPPLAFFCGSLVFLSFATTLLYFWGGEIWPFLITTTALFGVIAATGVVWWTKGRKILPVAALMSLPQYIAAKIPNFIATFAGRRKAWVRTKRDHE
jgi:cellulose synthase/poly-beta-1,6-N-acetylglucosamine synthase-like glycosyltransferase